MEGGGVVLNWNTLTFCTWGGLSEINHPKTDFDAPEANDANLKINRHVLPFPEMLSKPQIASTYAELRCIGTIIQNKVLIEKMLTSI